MSCRPTPHSLGCSRPSKCFQNSRLRRNSTPDRESRQDLLDAFRFGGTFHDRRKVVVDEDAKKKVCREYQVPARTTGVCEAQLWNFIGSPGLLRDDDAPQVRWVSQKLWPRLDYWGLPMRRDSVWHHATSGSLRIFIWVTRT